MRYLWVDYAKAIGIILVVYGHVARGMFNAGLPINESIYRVIDAIIYSFHMPLFFFLSGLFFIESLTKRGWRGLLANKIDSIVYPYVIWSILQGTVEVMLSQWTNFNINFSNVLSLFWQPRAQFWFLYALFFVTIVAIPIYARASKRYFLHIALVALVAYILKDFFIGISPIRYALANLCFFAMGIYFNQIKDLFYRNSTKILPIAAVIFLVAHYIFFNLYGHNYPSDGFQAPLIAFVSIIFVVVLCMKMSSFNIWFLSLIGSSSMAIYLAHVLAGSGIRIILTKFFHVNEIYTNLFFGCFFGIFVPMLLLKISARLHLSFLFNIPNRFSVDRAYNNSVKQQVG